MQVEPYVKPVIRLCLIGVSPTEFGIKTYYYWMRKIKREAFDALPVERKTRVLSNHVSQTSFAEIPRESENVHSSMAVVTPLKFI